MWFPFGLSLCLSVCPSLRRNVPLLALPASPVKTHPAVHDNHYSQDAGGFSRADPLSLPIPLEPLSTGDAATLRVFEARLPVGILPRSACFPHSVHSPKPIATSASSNCLAPNQQHMEAKSSTPNHKLHLKVTASQKTTPDEEYVVDLVLPWWKFVCSQLVMHFRKDEIFDPHKSQ